MSDTSICNIETYDTCVLPKNKDYDECILHCSKEKASADYHMATSELTEFKSKLLDYILESIFKTKDETNKFNRTLVMKYLTDPVSFEKDPKYDDTVKLGLLDSTIVFNHIAFPIFDGRDHWNYEPILNLLGSLWFNYCRFYVSSINLKTAKVYFQDCEFHQNWYLENYSMLKNVDDVIYQACIFYDDVSASKNEDLQKEFDLENTQFRDCTFNQKLSFENIKVKRLFNNSEYTNFKIGCLDISNCEVHDRFLLNKYCIESVTLSNTTFKNKFEFKDNCTYDFSIKDCNFDKLAEFFSTKFEKFIIFKSIFSDYIGFEYSSFGKNTVNKNNIADFKYMTCLSFVNFRNTEFFSGLDLENTNFKEDQNFLKTKINFDNTNRETCRIIKHSFDKIGNHVEANIFFSNEMKKLKTELKHKKWYSQKKLTLWFNEKISNFGQSYYSPLIILLISAAIFGILHYAYENNWLYKIKPEYNKNIESVVDLFNGWAHGYLPFSRFFVNGMEFISLLFYIINLTLIWQVVVAVKRHTRR